jgi:hypothetical protein
MQAQTCQTIITTTEGSAVKDGEMAERVRQAARAEAEANMQPEAVPSEYGFQCLDDVDPCDGYLYCRVSGRRQDLGAQKRGARRFCEEAGFGIEHTFGETVPGWSLDLDKRPALYRAIALCRQTGLPLFIPCTSRLLRSGNYHAHHSPHARPMVPEFEKLMNVLGGVEVLTLNDPDADPVDDEAFLGSLSAGESGRRVGRPRKKCPGYRRERRVEYLPAARKLRKQGKSFAEIARIVSLTFGIPISSRGIQNWLKPGSEP